MTNNSEESWYTLEMEENNSLLSKIERGRIKAYSLIAIGVLAVTLLVFSTLGPSVVNKYANGDNFTTAGQYGDSFGFVNALFSSLGFVGVAFALIIQIIEAHYQHQDRRRADSQQKQVSEQQFLSAVLDGIERWMKKYPIRPVKTIFEVDTEYVRIYRQSKISSVFFDVAMELILSPQIAVEDSQNIRERLRNDKRVKSVIIETELPAEVLNRLHKFAHEDIGMLAICLDHNEELEKLDSESLDQNSLQEAIRDSVSEIFDLLKPYKKARPLKDPSVAKSFALAYQVQTMVVKMMERIENSQLFGKHQGNLTLRQQLHAVEKIVDQDTFAIAKILFDCFKHP